MRDQPAAACPSPWATSVARGLAPARAATAATDPTWPPGDGTGRRPANRGGHHRPPATRPQPCSGTGLRIPDPCHGTPLANGAPCGRTVLSLRVPCGPPVARVIIVISLVRQAIAPGRGQAETARHQPPEGRGAVVSQPSPGAGVQPVQPATEPRGAQLSGWLFLTVVDGEMRPWQVGASLSFVLP